MADPRGLNMLNQVPTGGKRKENQHRDNQPRTKKRKKMKYETLEESWGDGAGEDLERIALEESAKRSFLQDGQVDRKAGSKSRQTTIRIWTREELMCRKIVENLIEDTAKRSNFMSSLQEDLEMAWLGRQEPLCEETRAGKEVPEYHAVDQEEETKEEKEEKEISPEGWKGDEPEEVRRARTTGGTLHQASQVVKENLPSGRKDKSIMEMFRSQEKKKMEGRIATLETEERMERKRRMETSWREKRNHYELLRWAKEWLTGLVLEQVTLAARKIMEDKVIEVEDIVGTIVQTSQEIPASRMDRLAKQSRKKQEYQDRMRRLENAMNELDFELKPECRLNVPSYAMRMEVSPVKILVSKFEEKIEVEKSDAEKPDVKALKKSPVKFLIEKFEQINVEGNLGLETVQCVQRMENKDGPGEVGLSCAKPDRLGYSLNSQCVQSMGRGDGPGKVLVSSAKPDMVASSMNTQNGMKYRKKVWGRKSSGLFGWKTVVVDKITSKNNIHTNSITQPTSVVKVNPKSQQRIPLENWLVIPKLQVGVEGGGGDISHTNSSENFAKIGNKENLENIQHFGFNNPGIEGKSPAKTED